MIYSATVSQLINSIESHSIGYETGRRPRSGSDSIGTRSIANSSSSQNSSCKSISDPAVLLSKAVLDLKRSVRESQEVSEEYWDAWNYWKRHPFVCGNVLLAGQLLLEHLLILTNLKYEDSSVLFRDLKDWLQSLSTTESSESTDNQQIIKIRDQLCAGFFLIYCKKFEESKGFLLQVQDLILPEYFDALQGELDKRNNVDIVDSGTSESNIESRLSIKSISSKLSILTSNASNLFTNFLFFLQEFATALLEKMKIRHGLLVAAIRSNAKNFALFCKKLIEILLKGMRIL